MSPQQRLDSSDGVTSALRRAVSSHDLTAIAEALAPLPSAEVIGVLERLGATQRALVFRLLPKDKALTVFEGLDATLQGDLVRALQHKEVVSVFAEMDPDDRVGLLDELPASVATRLLHDLPADEQELTAAVLGYPAKSIGRRMSPKFVAVRPEDTAGEALERVRAGLAEAENVYTLPVINGQRHLVGVISLRELMQAGPDTAVARLLRPVYAVEATAGAEDAARRCADLKLLAVPVVDAERRLVGILTVDDALRILEDADSEDQARLGGSEPLRRPYLSTPVRTLVRSRAVWLLVLAVGATLTVQVLEAFEATLEQLVVLSLFIPLLIGTGGNTGNQAATTLTRALALGDVRPQDILKVLFRELRVGLSLGLLLGSAGFALASWAYGVPIGSVIGLTLLSICTLAAAVGGAMPLIGKAVRVDPAVFSNPFITTFVDAAGLLVYFFIARTVLGL